MKCTFCGCKNTEISGTSVLWIKCNDCGQESIILDNKLIKELNNKSKEEYNEFCN